MGSSEVEAMRNELVATIEQSKDLKRSFDQALFAVKIDGENRKTLGSEPATNADEIEIVFFKGFNAGVLTIAKKLVEDMTLLDTANMDKASQGNKEMGIDIVGRYASEAVKENADEVAEREASGRDPVTKEERAWKFFCKGVEAGIALTVEKIEWME